MRIKTIPTLLGYTKYSVEKMSSKPSPDTSKVLFIIGVLMFVLSSCIVGAYFFLRNPPQEESAKMVLPDTYLDLPEIKTTFSNYGVIHAKVTLALDHEGVKKEKALETAKTFLPLISASLTSVLNSLSPTEIKQGGLVNVEKKARKKMMKKFLMLLKNMPVMNMKNQQKRTKLITIHQMTIMTNQSIPSNVYQA